jgi:steroid 5-alpha reductase family enzyme
VSADVASALATSFAVTAAVMFALWLLSLARRDASIVDIYWGLGFVVIAAVAFARGDGYPPRKLLVLCLTALWGIRLAGYLAWRNWGHGEDYRYQAMRKRWGKRFGLVSLFLVFGLQAVLMWIVSLPIQHVQVTPLPARLTWLDGLGVLLWGIGLTFEALGDWQLARFKADAENRGKVMDRGLWRYTRHPNYFGDAVVWWGFFCLSLATERGLRTVVGPLLMTFLLMRVSGVALLERRLSKTKSQYRDYAQRTNAFFPGPPQGG